MGLVERRLTSGEGLDLARVDVDADHFVPDRRHRGRVDGTEVSAADHRQAHEVLRSRGGAPREHSYQTP
jgi:hypothetical protein